MNNILVCIVDYGLGNLTSVKNTLEVLGVPSVISSSLEDIQDATHLILPGVGSFKHGMDGLEGRGLIPILREEVCTKKKKILGICLGMQLFATYGFENGKYKGLDFIKGKVIEIDTTQSKLRLPHIGWNTVHVAGTHILTEGFEADPIFYFVHSYQYIPEDSNIIAGTCDYGISITALIEHVNIFGAQFHPEKSQEDGLRIFRNFLSI